MRVTNQLVANTVTRELFQQTEDLLELESKISTGKRINKPSDDPIGMSKVLDYGKTLSKIEQYKRNISHGTSWLNLTESTLGTLDSIVVNAKEIAVYQATGTANDADRQMAAQEVKHIYDQIIQLANTKLGDSYIFSGYKTDAAPFSRDENFNITYHGDDSEIQTKLGEGVSMTINANGADVFHGDASVFDSLKGLMEALENNDMEMVSAQIETLDAALDQTLEAQVQVGAKLDRMTTTKSYWDNFELDVTEMLSETEDADLTEAVIKLTSREAAYQACLSVAAKMIQPTLMSFLR